MITKSVCLPGRSECVWSRDGGGAGWVPLEICVYVHVVRRGSSSEDLCVYTRDLWTDQRQLE